MTTQHTQGTIQVCPHDMSLRGPRKEKGDHFGEFVADVTGSSDADARRLVACWNACEGLSTESLERSEMLSSMNQQRRQLETQNNQLLDAALAARRTAKLVTDKSGHELIAIEPQLWRAIQDACQPHTLPTVEHLPADDTEGGAL